MSRVVAGFVSGFATQTNVWLAGERALEVRRRGKDEQGAYPYLARVACIRALLVHPDDPPDAVAYPAQLMVTATGHGISHHDTNGQDSLDVVDARSGYDVLRFDMIFDSNLYTFDFARARGFWLRPVRVVQGANNQALSLEHQAYDISELQGPSPPGESRMLGIIEVLGAALQVMEHGYPDLRPLEVVRQHGQSARSVTKTSQTAAYFERLLGSIVSPNNMGRLITLLHDDPF